MYNNALFFPPAEERVLDSSENTDPAALGIGFPPNQVVIKRVPIRMMNSVIGPERVEMHIV